MTEEQFLLNEIWILAWNASVQRTNLYKRQLSSEDKKTSGFRASIIKHVEKELLPSYIRGCSEEQHYSNIESFIALANTIGSDVLGVNGYKLRLYLRM